MFDDDINKEIRRSTIWQIVGIFFIIFSVFLCVYSFIIEELIALGTGIVILIVFIWVFINKTKTKKRLKSTKERIIRYGKF